MAPASDHLTTVCSCGSVGRADLPSVTFGDLTIALAQACGIPCSGGGNSLLGGECRIDDRGGAGHVNRLEAVASEWSLVVTRLAPHLGVVPRLGGRFPSALHGHQPG